MQTREFDHTSWGTVEGGPRGVEGRKGAIVDSLVGGGAMAEDEGVGFGDKRNCAVRIVAEEDANRHF